MARTTPPDSAVYAQVDTGGVRVPPNLAAFCHAGLSALRPGGPRAPFPAGSTVPTQTVYKEFGEAVGQPVRCVVRGQAEWAALWAEMTRTQPSPRPLPQVDFGERMLLVAGMGIRPSTGFSIGIDEVRRAGDELAATVVHYLPGDGCTGGMAETEPLDVVSVPRQDGPVRFIEKISYAPDCDE